MNIDTIALHSFIAVAETMSFTKAAEAVGRTQSAISQQIAKLEHLLDKPLIIRGREPSLTLDGEIFLTYARKIYALQCELSDRFKEPDLEGEIHLGLPEDFASVILTDVLLAFARFHPRVILNVECDLTLNLLKAYEQNRLDLIVIKNNSEQHFQSATHIWTEKVEWVGNPKRLTQLDKNSIIPLILSPSPCVYRENVIKVLEENQLKWTMTYSSPSYSGKMAAVRAGLGITAIQKKMIPEDLQILDDDFLPALNDIQISLMKREGVSKPIDSLAYFILEKLQHLV
ncbi:MAG: LysR family transcriptional regulator [Gammaproteobacteria bacterium]|nr:LysR family transcriptional regulator [Gammaproteobacteria bacterium]